VGAGAAIVVLGTAVVNLAIPAQWSRFILGYASVDYTYVVPALIGPFVHPAAFGRVCAIIAIAVYCYRLVVTRSRLSAVLLFASGLMAIFSFRVKTVVGLLVTFLTLRLGYLSAGVVLAGLVLLPIGVLLSWDALYNFIGKDLQAYVFETSARSTISLGSLDVAAQYFPFGAGFGRYGSFIAAANYSPEYSVRGFESVYGLGSGDGEGDFLTDTQWPAILGEAGWLGAICFLIGICRAAWVMLRRTSGTETAISRWVRVTGLGWLVLFLVESVAAPVFGSSPAYPFAFAAVGVTASVLARNPKSAPETTGSRLRHYDVSEA
jgi:hypothetical protein